MKQLFAFLLISLLAAGVLLVGCSDDDGPTGTNGSYGVVSGTVVEVFEVEVDTATVDSSVGIFEALVQVDGTNITTYTDSSGSYTLEAPVGTINITVYKDGYTDGTAADVVVTEGETTTVNFSIEPGQGSIPNQPIVGMWMLSGMAVNGNDIPEDGFLVITLTYRADSTGLLAYRGYSEEFCWSLSGGLLSMEGSNLANMTGTVSGYNITFEKSESGNVVTQVFTKQHNGTEDNLDLRLIGKWELSEVAIESSTEPPDTTMKWDLEFYNTGLGSMTLENFSERFKWSTSEDRLFLFGDVYIYSILGDTLSGDTLTGYDINWHTLVLDGAGYGKHYYYTFEVWEDGVEEEDADTTEGFIDVDLVGSWDLIGRKFNFVDIPIDSLPAIGFSLLADSTGESFIDDSTRSLTWSVNETLTRAYFTYENEDQETFFYEIAFTDTSVILKTEYMKNNIFYNDVYLNSVGIGF
ncbi:carboxypeptidase-like regulatory domain-containing protein [bacterium]|nr:carboxypeptidase-like regulatory domain-containing protein [bacterium]